MVRHHPHHNNGIRGGDLFTPSDYGIIISKDIHIKTFQNLWTIADKRKLERANASKVKRYTIRDSDQQNMVKIAHALKNAPLDSA